MYNRIKIRITGKNIDYILKEIIRREINIYSLSKNNNNLDIIINYYDYQELRKIKTTYKIVVLKRYGLNKYLRIIRNYLYIIIFLVLGIIIDIILSNMIFKVEIIHPNKKLVKTIEKDLNKLGLKKYNFRLNYKEKEKLKEKILEIEKDKIEWIEINRKGTKYIVELEQRKNKKENKECQPRHITSKKQAIILAINSQSGEITKKKNDYVEKDEVIISGLIHNKDKIVNKKCAIGKVYGEVWYTALVSVPKKYSEEKILKDKSYDLEFNFLNHKYNINNKLKHYKKYKNNIITSRIIPISINLVKIRKTKLINKIYDKNNVSSISLDLATKEIKKKLKKDESIISKKVLKKTEKNSKIEVEVFFKIKENITNYKDISNINIEELNKETGD